MRVVGPEAPHIAQWITVAVLLGYVLNSVVVTWPQLPRPQLASFVLSLVLVLILQLLHSLARPLTWPAPTRLLTLAAQTLITFLPLAWVGPQAAAMAGFLAGSMLLVIARPVRWILYAGVSGAVLVALWAMGLGWVDVLYGTYITLLAGLMIYAISVLTSLVGLVFAGRAELARVAIVRERERVARDLHDLLGFHVSAMTLRGELVYRLLPDAAERAGKELGEVLRLARRALVEVRLVTDGYRPMSFADEVGSTRSILSAAGIDADVTVDLGGVPREVETVLAIVLREATTNVLRHSAARRCTVVARRAPTYATLQVASDGVEPAEDTAAADDRHGTGLANLVDRLTVVGGTLTVSVNGRWFHVGAQVPLSGVVNRTAATRLEEAAPEGPSALSGLGRPWHLRVARTIAVAVILGYAALPVVNVLSGTIGVGALAGFVACMVVQASVVLRYAVDDRRPLPGRLRAGTLAVQLVATILPLLWIHAPWGSMGGFLAGTVLLALPGRGWPLFLGIGFAVGALAVFRHEPAPWSAYLVMSTLLTGLVLSGIGSLSSLVAQVNQMRDELARTAVARERSRVARDLDELLGRDLSQLAAECRTACGRLGHDPDLAKAAVAEMLGVCRRTLATVRTAAGGYRYTSLTAELNSTASVLEAAGVQLDVEPPRQAVPHALEQALGVALREAVANVLRHSEARWCRIRICRDGGNVRLDVTNDGTLTSTDPVLAPASGLGDLASGIRLLGGRLTARASPDRTFRLLVDLPVAGGVPTDSHQPPATRAAEGGGSARGDGSDALT